MHGPLRIKGRSDRARSARAPSHEETSETAGRQPTRSRRTEAAQNQMQSRAELYKLLSYFDYEALDRSIVKTIIPEIDNKINGMAPSIPLNREENKDIFDK